ncbi:MAG: MarC family protein [Rhodospirillales bacterium]
MTADLNIVTCLVALLAIMNPIGNIPLFLVMTEGDDAAQRRRTALVTSLAVMITLMVVALAGADILEALGITVDDLRIAGGLVILLIGMSMLHSETSAIHNSAAETEEGRRKESPAIVPLAIPLTAGPGAMATVIVYAKDARQLLDYASLAAAIAAASFATYFAFRASAVVKRAFGVSGMNIMVRIMGLLLASIAVGMIATGLKGIFPGLSR